MTLGEEGQQKRVRLAQWLSSIRFQEVLVLQGPPFMGVAFRLQDVTFVAIPTLLVFSVATFCLLAHVFSFNDWAGIGADLNDPNKLKDVFLTKGITRRQVGTLSVSLGLSSLALYSLLPIRTLLLAVGIIVLGLLYSHPRIHGKGIPIISSCLHLTGGVLHFLLGYSLFGGIDLRGVLIGLFFALIFTAGHLNQEVRDYEGDRLNGILTNGVRFGKRRMFIISFLLFIFSYGYLWGLARYGLVPPALGNLIVLSPVQGYLFWRTLKAGLTFQSVTRFQAQYRLLYAGIGLFIIATLLLQVLSSSGVL
jgi:4-hydroxybenzoate polyprenyltransferase